VGRVAGGENKRQCGEVRTDGSICFKRGRASGDRNGEGDGSARYVTGDRITDCAS
jgi:hypothetical protein